MIENLVREQYGTSVNLLERGGLTEGVIIPSERECIDILRDSLTDKQITHVAEKMRRAVFQIVPQKPFADFENAINLNRWPVQGQTNLTPYIRERFAKMPSSNEIQIGLVEGQARLPSTPLIRFPLKKQEVLYKKSLPEGITVIHPRNYSLLQLNVMLNWECIDMDDWSILEDNSKDRTYFPVGSWCDDQVRFREYFPEPGNHDVRWRSAVMISTT